MRLTEKPRLDVSEAMLSDQFALRKTFQKLQQGKLHQKQIEDFKKTLELSCERRNARKLKYSLSYPDLPISDNVVNIKSLLEQHQVIIVGGETGSGKSTQLPKICLEMGFGEGGMIAHTQPRRIAARTLSQRIADELGKDIPSDKYENLVACKVRFSDSVKPDTQIKLMTDGMLLAEIEQDRFLEQYQCVIVDEVHERSLNIDFLLAYLKRLIQRRTDLKIILTSATIDLEKLSDHFDGAPVLEVSGRTYPVELVYRESMDREFDLELVDAIENLLQRKPPSPLAKDILVFLPTEREIRQYSLRLRRAFLERVEVLPLYGRMPLEQQRKIFSPVGSKRRIILSTNVAETSVTVPGIGFVVDSGFARVSRYNVRNKIQQLPIEKISKASANQRAGRCGRVAPGVCVRLYSEEDFDSRADFTEAEIQRTNLSAVLLKHASLNLGEFEKFSLIDVPDKKLVNDARNQLSELKAFEKENKLSQSGRMLARIPLDPRFSRMLLEADIRGCLFDVLIIVCGLSVNDPRLRPHESQQEADARHTYFQHDRSDFYSYLKLWYLLEYQRQELSNKKFRDYCEQHFLSWSSLREWRELHTQLTLLLRQLGYKLVQTELSKKDGLNEQDVIAYLDSGEEALNRYSSIHQSILTGCLSQIAHIDSGFAYQGLRHRQVFIFPGSGLMKKRYPWLMCAQLIETSKLFGHCCAEIDSQWIVDIGSHVLKSRYFDPYWSKRHGSIRVNRELSLQGLIVESNKSIKLTETIRDKISENPVCIFIQGALIERRFIKPPKALQQHWDYLDSLKELEHKHRRAEFSPDDFYLMSFYQDRIPDSVYDVRSFAHWLKSQDEEVFKLSYDADLDQKQKEAFPDVLSFGQVDARCDYLFDPASDFDGLSLSVPYDQINQLSQSALEWLVPGLLEEKCEYLIKSLPKSIRKQCLPIPETVTGCLNQLRFGEGDLFENLAKALQRKLGKPLAPSEFDLDKLPSHLRVHIKVVDEKGRLMTRGENLEELRNELRMSSINVDSLPKVDSLQIQNEFFTKWDFGDLQKVIEIEREGLLNLTQGSEVSEKKRKFTIKKYTALKVGDANATKQVSIVYCESKSEAEILHAKGQLCLAELSLSAQKRELKKQLKNFDSISLQLFSAGDANQILEDLFSAVINELCFGGSLKQEYVYTESDFNLALEKAKSGFYKKAIELNTILHQTAELVFQLRQSLSTPVSDLRQKHHQMVEMHLLSLIAPEFIKHVPLSMLERYPVYIQAMLFRLERLQGNIDRDAQLQADMETYRARLSQIKPPRDFQAMRWYMEEYALSLFAQTIRPAFQVSRKHLEKCLQDLGV